MREGRQKRCGCVNRQSSIPVRPSSIGFLEHPRLLMRGLSGAKIEIGLATMVYDLKRITNVLEVARWLLRSTRSVPVRALY